MNQKKEQFSIQAEFRENICTCRLTGLEKLFFLASPASQVFSEQEMAWGCYQQNVTLVKTSRGYGCKTYFKTLYPKVERACLQWENDFCLIK